jgi:hypothetical protein
VPEPEQRIVVFISSAQHEFEHFRQQVRSVINNERWSTSKLHVMRARLIENQRGPVIADEIRRGLDESSIYLGLFGNQLRDWPVAEYRYARARGLPQLIYKFQRRSRPGRPRRRSGGRISEVDRFLKEQVQSYGVRIRGPYRNLDDLLEDMLGDLATVISRMVSENAELRKTLYTGMPGI